MLDKLKAIKERYMYLEEQMSDPATLADMKKYRKVGKDYKKLEPIVKAYDEYQSVVDAISESKEILRTEDDEELKEMAKEELDELQPRRAELEEEIKI